MDIFEKQRKIEAIREIVKMRWFNIAIVVALGLVLKTKFFGGWAQEFKYGQMAALSVFAFGYNFIYWFFIRRPVGMINEKALRLITFCQVAVDQITYTIVFYYSGTVETSVFLLYFVTILIASSLYKAKGIVLAGILAVFLHNTVLIAEYYGIIPHFTAYEGTVWFGNLHVTYGRMIGFTFFTAAAVLFSVALSALFRKREVYLRQQRDKLTEQAQQLVLAKDDLQSALAKSDIARKAATKARDEMEEANVELKSKVGELKGFYRITVGREVKMADLKSEIKKLKETVKKLEDELTKK